MTVSRLVSLTNGPYPDPCEMGAAMSEIIDRCISLEELRIGMGIDITGDCFLRLSSHNAGSRLRRLDFNNCPLPRATFHHIASVCTSTKDAFLIQLTTRF